MEDELTPTIHEYRALDLLVNSTWFFEEMENANYHSAFYFLMELRDEAEEA